MPAALRFAACCALLASLAHAGDPAATSLAGLQLDLDVDHDGHAEIASFDPLFDARAPAPDGKLVYLLVEPRVLQLSAARDGDPLRAALATWAADLSHEGFAPVVRAVECPPAATHQDGRYVLAFRALFRAARAAFPNFAGVVFVGHFPDALLVRTCAWQRDDAFTLRAGTPTEAKYPQGTPWIRCVPELVAHRADIVLADLDGDWESAYIAQRTPLPSISGAFPSGIPPGGAGLAADAEWSTIEYEDCFHVADGHAVRGDDGTRFLAPTDGADGEVSAADRARPNRMALPDIGVSRIDARGVALQPVPELRDEQGRPRAGLAGKATPRGWIGDAWHHDDALEFALLLQFLDRDHRYRTGALKPAFVPSSLECGLGSGFDELRAASPAWAGIERAGLDVADSPDLLAAARWLQRDSVLRTLRAHSDPWGSAFGKPDLAALTAFAGAPWAFSVKEGAFVPSLDRACGGGKLDFFLLRTLYENHPRDSACFWLHMGCESISPAGADRLPWSDPGYGFMNGAEALLFYANGLALLGRAKVFYDEPRGFAETLAAGGTFGEAWRRYFEIESAAGSWREVGDDIGRKRAYFWSVIGDWTLTLKSP